MWWCCVFMRILMMLLLLLLSSPCTHRRRFRYRSSGSARNPPAGSGATGPNPSSWLYWCCFATSAAYVAQTPGLAVQTPRAEMRTETLYDASAATELNMSVAACCACAEPSTSFALSRISPCTSSPRTLLG